MQPRVLAVATLVEPHPLMLLPFVTMLRCFALLPFILKDRWEANYHLIARFLAIAAAYYLFGISATGTNPARSRRLHSFHSDPNFMIKTIAEQYKMHTPSFVGFVIKFSLPILLRCFR